MAGTSFNLKFDEGDLLKVNLLLGEVKNGAPKVMTRAINKTLTFTKSEAVKTIAIDLNLTQDRIREDFWTVKADFENVSGAVWAHGRPVNLSSFIGTTETVSDFNGGVSVKVKKSGSRVRLRHAFLWTRFKKPGLSINPETGALIGDIAQTAFQREWHDYHTFRSRFSPWKKFGPKYRLPVETLSGPRIEDEYAKDRVMNPVLIETKAELDRRLNEELEIAFKALP